MRARFGAGRRLRVAALGALYALPMAVPFFFDRMSDDLGGALIAVGFFGVALVVVVLQVREAAVVSRADQPLLWPVLTISGSFYVGAMLVLAIAFIPVANVLGTFDLFPTYTGARLFGLLAAAFGIWTAVGSAVVLCVAGTRARLKERLARPT